MDGRIYMSPAIQHQVIFCAISGTGPSKMRLSIATPLSARTAWSKLAWVSRLPISIWTAAWTSSRHILPTTPAFCTRTMEPATSPTRRCLRDSRWRRAMSVGGLEFSISITMAGRTFCPRGNNIPEQCPAGPKAPSRPASTNGSVPLPHPDPRRPLRLRQIHRRPHPPRSPRSPRRSLRPHPHTERQVLKDAHHYRVLAYDHITHLPPRLQDALARVSTGAGLQIRDSSRDPVNLTVRTPVILTANENWKPRADLESRAVHIQLAVIPESEQLPEREILDRAEELLPSLLATLCQAIAKRIATNHWPDNRTAWLISRTCVTDPANANRGRFLARHRDRSCDLAEQSGSRAPHQSQSSLASGPAHHPLPHRQPANDHHNPHEFRRFRAAPSAGSPISKSAGPCR